MTAVIIKSEADRLASILAAERIRHGKVEALTLKVVEQQQAQIVLFSKQITLLNEQLTETRESYIKFAADNLKQETN